MLVATFVGILINKADLRELKAGIISRFDAVDRRLTDWKQSRTGCRLIWLNSIH
jgi:hypothetical protein